MTDTATLFHRATDQFGSRVARIRDDQWTNDTPCTEWDVRALVRHLVYENLWFPRLMGGGTIEQIGDRFEGDILGDDPVGAWTRASEASLAVAAEPDAFTRTVQLSRGPTPAEGYAWEMIMDHTIHGWDLARGIGADDTMDPELASRLWEWLQPNLASFILGLVRRPGPGPRRRRRADQVARGARAARVAARLGGDPDRPGSHRHRDPRRGRPGARAPSGRQPRRPEPPAPSR